MNDSIKVGDLVMSVRGTECGCPPSGKIFVVTKIRLTTPTWVCEACDAEHSQEICAEGSGVNSMTVLRKLKRIPPLEELKSHKEPADLAESMRNLRELLLTR